ncbi:MAG: hypothetical protein JW787_15105 [Sedimentisphaerales bacterium]|nr:hypothetical protein [Sedimentisphaerales bacterium]
MFTKMLLQKSSKNGGCPHLFYLYMKNKLIDGLESIVKGIGKSVKNARKNILTTAAAVALPFMFNTNADASIGKLQMWNTTKYGNTRNKYVTSHYGESPEVTEGFDDGFDFVYKEAPPFPGINFTCKIFSIVDDKKLMIDVVPENSQTDRTVYFSFVTDSGDPITLTNNELTINLVDIYEETAFANEDVTMDINGNTYDLKTTTSIPMPTGTFNSDEVYTTGVIHFTPIQTITLATLDTEQPVNVTPTGFTASAVVGDDGYSAGDTTWSAGFFYKPASSSEWMQTGEISGSGEGTFQADVSGLSQNTQYEIVAYLTNSAGTAYGDTEKLTTTYTIAAPTVITLDAKNITYSSGSLLALLEDDGNPTTTSAQTSFVYYTNGGTQIETPWQTTTEGAEFSSDISGLDPSTIYMYFARAKNSEKTAAGSTKNFKTLQAPVKPIDPNSSPVAINPDLPTIIIQNFVPQFRTDPNKPHQHMGNWAYIETRGNLEGIDANDISFTSSSGLNSEITSTVMEFTQDPDEPGTIIIDEYKLLTQANPQDPGKDILIPLTITGDPSSIIDSENFLRLWANDPNSEDPNTITTSFAGPLTLQQFDPNMLDFEGNDPNKIDIYDPNLTRLTNSKYPARDLKKYINKKQDIQLENIATTNSGADPNTAKTIVMGEPYAYFVISRTGEVADIDGSGKVDANDLDAFAPYLDTGSGRGDVYSVKDKEIGMTDNATTLEDGEAVAAEVYRMNPNQPMNARFGLREDFEDNNFNIWLKNNSSSPWELIKETETITTGGGRGVPPIITTIDHYHAKSGPIYGSGSSELEFGVNMESAGILSFDIKTTIPASGNAILYIDNKGIKSWSGNLDWRTEQRSLPAGNHNIKIIYQGSSGSQEDNAVYLDNLKVIPNEYLGAN